MTAIALTNVAVYPQEQGLAKTDNSPYELKQIFVELPNTAQDTNTVTLNLTNYGITTPKIIKGFVHTTNYDYSRIAVEAPTTSGTAGVFVVTVGGSDVTGKRAYLIGGI